MNIHIDILTPKQVMMFKPLFMKLRNFGHMVHITSRDYHELNQMVKLHDLETEVLGSHGGGDLYSKLIHSITRTKEIAEFIHDLDPDICVSHGSPEVARASYGLSKPNINVNDSPHSVPVSKLTVPFCSKLLTPEMIPIEEWTKYGIEENSIVRYHALDPWAWLKDHKTKINIRKKLGIDNKKPIITFRVLETKASYARGTTSPVIPVIHNLIQNRSYVNIVVLPRYKNQINELVREFKGKAIIPNNVVDGPTLLKNSSVFIGAGGTMTIEAALLGVPSISCHPKNVLHYIIWLQKNNLTEIIEHPKKITKKIEEYLDNPDMRIFISKRAEEITSKFVDPNEIIIQEIEKFE